MYIKCILFLITKLMGIYNHITLLLYIIIYPFLSNDEINLIIFIRLCTLLSLHNYNSTFFIATIDKELDNYIHVLYIICIPFLITKLMGIYNHITLLLYIIIYPFFIIIAVHVRISFLYCKYI